MKRQRGSTGQEFPQEWKEFVGLLRKHRVKYVVVGGHALGVLGKPRHTGDFDVLVEPSKKNAPRVCAALREFGYGIEADLDYFSKPQRGFA